MKLPNENDEVVAALKEINKTLGRISGAIVILTAVLIAIALWSPVI